MLCDEATASVTLFVKAIYEWGQTLATFYEKDEIGMRSDPTIQYLGYWTDEGAYYYWNPEQQKNYEQTVMDVISNFRSNNIPYRFAWYLSYVSHLTKVIAFKVSSV